MFPNDAASPIPFPAIMGPTASGKSALALELAGTCSGEIVSADSMQIYKGLDIGTAKPTPAERAEIPHHLIDLFGISRKFDVYSFRAEAERLIAEIRARGRLPVVAGGTGLYLRGLLYGLDDLPSSPELRARLDALYDNDVRFEELRGIMRVCAPADFAAFGTHRRKLIRACEVFQLTGKEMTAQRTSWGNAPRSDARSFVLVWENSELRRRIETRCARMLASGWIEEAESFLKKGLPAAPTAWQALGYRQIGLYLAGGLKRSGLQEEIVRATWRFARRQNTWFRTQHPEALRIPMPNPRALRIVMETLGTA